MSEPTQPPQREPRTPEEIRRLAAEQNGHVVTDLDDSGISDPFVFSAAGPDMSTGDVIDAEIVEDEEETPESKPADRTGRSRRGAKDRPPRDAKTGPPNLDEWVNFFSRVVLRVTTEWYINYAFRGVDEEMLTDREVERLAMTDEERQMIAVPFAEISNKSKFMRKHGRMIVASGDAFNALVVLGAWASRVNRIASKYKPKQPVKGVTLNGSSGQSTPNPGEQTQGATGGHFPPGWYGPVVPGSG